MKLCEKMQLIEKISDMKEYSLKVRKEGKTIGFVPTMGYLHEGHLSLIRAARKECDAVVVSIFVNPMQFGPKEDFKEYPRDLERDKGLAGEAGADIVFYPSSEEMYSEGFSTFVNVEGRYTETLCAFSRPGHFKGVATVVLKLLNIVSPDVSYFGQKDAQQAAVIKKMIKDLNMDTDIRIMPIVREDDGLAMSSRNVYLSEDERRQALNLYRSLEKAKEMVCGGEASSTAIKSEMKRIIEEGKDLKIDYIETVDADSLEPVETVKENTLIAVAVFIGKTRLIDNIIIGDINDKG